MGHNDKPYLVEIDLNIEYACMAGSKSEAMYYAHQAISDLDCLDEFCCVSDLDRYPCDWDDEQPVYWNRGSMTIKEALEFNNIKEDLGDIPGQMKFWEEEEEDV